VLEEIEYVTSFLNCEVIRVSMDTQEVTCGFWSESSGPTSRTIVLLGANTVLAQVSRKKTGKSYKSQHIIDVRAPVFRATLPIVRDSHAVACSIAIPTLSDALTELQLKSLTQYEFILDPFGRVQSVFVPRVVLLPIHPSHVKNESGIPTRPGYADIELKELPTGSTARAFLSDTKHAKFKVQSNVFNVWGMVVELELASGFRVPIRYETVDNAGDASEVVRTTRNARSEDPNLVGEAVLVDGEPNKADTKLAQDTTYASEIYEFLMFSLSKDIAVDPSGEILKNDSDSRTEYDPDALRTMIKNRTGNLYNALKKWFNTEAYQDSTTSPVEFVNKVRTPCGQLTEDTCSKSTLCGLYKGTCRIRVKPIVDKDAVLKRMVKTLRDNVKQRALVLDGRMSPFFSTVLYLEMPHELITTSI
jgi:hypothetical protein